MKIKQGLFHIYLCELQYVRHANMEGFHKDSHMNNMHSLRIEYAHKYMFAV